MKNEKFYNVSKQATEDSLNYFLNLIITARIETGVRSNSLCLDEDVNVYAAQVLKNFSHPTYLAETRKYVHLYESDLIARQSEYQDLRERFYLYKHTADHLFFMIGILRGINKNVPTHHAFFRLSDEVYIARARAYYAEAAEYQHKLRGRADGVSEVLSKLSAHFPVYLNLFYHISEHYFGFIEKFSDGEWFHFIHKNIIHKEGVDSRVYVQLMDEFLCHLSSWKKGHHSEDRDLLRILSAELKRLNPDFHYNVESILAARAA
ncbi:MAG: hypothetical protein A2293_01025 [Elusimicrobia bacterium RIFOXYB2_FULL_49_7]|nr:MAG: hypothetical protein A2293_01025 [Elusimicrobia bacterium RIFOXYB2_FULL_49_7]